MTLIAVVLIAALVAEGLLGYRQERAWEKERQLLLERIQAPERVHVAAVAEPQENGPEPDADQQALVGAIIDGEPTEGENG